MTLLGLRMAWVAGLWLAVGASGPGQSVPAVPPSSAQGVLLEMASHAGVIFSGQVLGITRAEGYVDVRFRVDHPVRGISKAGAYVLREWAGLWSGGDRYCVGKQYMLLLTARGPGGMSAPVDGMDGAIPLIAGGAAAVMDAQGNIAPDTADLAPEWRVDVRWLNARAVREISSSGGRRDVQPEMTPVVQRDAQRDVESIEAAVPVAADGAGKGLLPLPVERWQIPPRLWVGPIAPLPATGGSAQPGGTMLGLPLSTILATLQGGVGGVHAEH